MMTTIAMSVSGGGNSGGCCERSIVCSARAKAQVFTQLTTAALGFCTQASLFFAHAKEIGIEWCPIIVS